MKNLRRIYSNLAINTIDGIKIFFDNHTWVHIRPSATEMALRIIGESDDEDKIESLILNIKTYIETHII